MFVESDRVKKKHLGTVKCPHCGELVEILEREVIEQPFQKKVSTKSLEAASSVQKQL